MSAEYLVGYKKPPKHSQFKKGQSGNPNGRPRGSTNIRAVFQKVVERRVSIRRGENVCKASVVEAMFLAISERAAKGDSKAFNSVMKLAGQLQLLNPPPSFAVSSPDPQPPAFQWTEEDEMLSRFLEGVPEFDMVPTGQIYRGGVLVPNPELQADDIRSGNGIRPEEDSPTNPPQEKGHQQ
jgi:hypothetical protein